MPFGMGTSGQTEGGTPVRQDHTPTLGRNNSNPLVANWLLTNCSQWL